MNLGKQKRLKSFFREGNDNTIIVPIDHGVTMGPISGIENIKATIAKLGQHKVDGIILHKGLINACEKEIVDSNLSVIMHLSASTSLGQNSNYKVTVGTVKEALSFGCNAVSIHLNIGNEFEADMFRDVAKVAEDCYKYGMPLLAMMYARGAGINDELSVDNIKHVARIGAELGSDLIKVNYSERGGDFKEVVEGCPVPIIIAGGEKCNTQDEFLKRVSSAMKTGIHGVSVGRNIFQGDNMDYLMSNLDEIVRHGVEFEDNASKRQVG